MSQNSCPLPMSTPQAPLIDDQDSKHNLVQPQNDVVLEQSLNILETVLNFFGFFQISIFTTLLSWVVFISLAIALPVLRANFLHCSHCEKFEIQTFDLQVAVFQAISAAISLVCISHNLRKYGLRKLLFVDRHHGYVYQFREQYMQRIKIFYRFLGSWFTVCLLLKIARELARLMIYVDGGSWWQSIVIFFVSLLSWTYTTLIFLLGTALFNLVGNLQVIHFENYGKLLEKDLDVSVYIEEHMRLTNYLSKISHRFRLFLLLQFLFVSVCQFITLLQTTENQSFVNFINAGDFAVLTIVQIVGLVFCLSAAAKLSHRAQGLGSVASRWHALVTCNSGDAPPSFSANNSGILNDANQMGSYFASCSESDLESFDNQAYPTINHTQITSVMSTYHKRQAFVAYVQSNTGGFTIFGWLFDRVLVNTIFFIELSFVMFVLGKTIAIPVR
ncbi:guanyl-nucleotide exchange factor [Lithospermum erythrorhizon]|uniref:Guanyl-nucleotide exchange factor n=1 Tax=Lithospermum erythrorhizon TaxID=34254 RepID=A0AAV3R4X0_LITER